MAADNINEAAELFKRVGQQTTLEDGRHEAGRLQRGDDAAVEPSDSDFEQSAAELDSAAAQV